MESFSLACKAITAFFDDDIMTTEVEAERRYFREYLVVVLLRKNMEVRLKLRKRQLK